MKYLLFYSLVLLHFNSNAQTDTLITYSSINYVDSVSKNELFDRAKLWIANSFKDGKTVIQIENRDLGQILCKGNFPTYYTYKTIGARKIPVDCFFTINMLFKDGKYKVDIYDLSVKNSEYNRYDFGPVITSAIVCPVSWPMGNRQSKVDEMWNEVKHNIDVEIRSVLDQIKIGFQKKINTDF